jgi:FixJ family two-component response regulator
MTRKTEKPLVRIVDDDPDQLASLEIMLSAEGWDVACYERASDFFAEDTPSRPGCLILDVRMPEISGLEMQEELNRREYPLPILFLTGHGDVDMAVHTLKKGAKDFLLKPVDAPRLLTSVATIVQEDCDQRAMPLDSAAWKRKFRELTEREQEIVRYVASGLLNRQIAERLGISERTVHAHRLSAYRKLNVHNVADLAPLTVLFIRKEL